MACIDNCARIAFDIYVVSRKIRVVSIVITSSHFLRRLLLHLVELLRAYESLVLVHEMRINVAIISISFVNDFHIARNFTFDTLIRLSLHLSLFFCFLSSFLHIVN